MSRLEVSNNRWGDPTVATKRPLSGIAVAAVIVSAWALGIGLLLGVVPNDALQSAVGRPIATALPLASFVSFALGMVLAYLALSYCRLDRPIAGRGLAWAAVGMSYVSLFAWYALLSPLVSPLASAGLYVIAAVTLLHLLVFAAESAAGKYVLLGILIGGTLFAVVSCLLIRSREQARQLQARDHLRQIGMELQRLQELHRSRQREQSRESAIAAPEDLNGETTQPIGSESPKCQ